MSKENTDEGIYISFTEFDQTSITLSLNGCVYFERNLNSIEFVYFAMIWHLLELPKKFIGEPIVNFINRFNFKFLQCLFTLKMFVKIIITYKHIFEVNEILWSFSNLVGLLNIKFAFIL